MKLNKILTTLVVGILLFSVASVAYAADTVSNPLSKIPDLTMYRAAKTPANDGKVTSGEYGKPVYTLDTKTANLVCNSPRPDAKGIIYLTYDNSNLYIAVESTESTEHKSIDIDASVWMVDCLQLNVLMLNPANYKYSTNKLDYNTELGFGTKNDGSSIAFRWNAVVGKRIEGAEYGPSDGDDFSKAAEKPKVVVARAGNVCTYEVALPWSELTPTGVSLPKDKDIIGIGIALLSSNWSDSAKSVNGIEVGKSIIMQKNPSLTCKLTLGGTAPSDTSVTSSKNTSSVNASSSVSQKAGSSSNGTSSTTTPNSSIASSDSNSNSSIVSTTSPSNDDGNSNLNLVLIIGIIAAVVIITGGVLAVKFIK